MPPTQHSNSTAHKESDGLQPNGLYTLGEYSFRLERSSVPGSTNDSITAVCMQGEKNARKSIQVPSSTQIMGWYVEANDTEASIYVNIKSQPDTPVTGDFNSTLIPAAASTRPEDGVPIGTKGSYVIMLNLREAMKCTFETRTKRVVCGTSTPCRGSCSVWFVPDGGGRGTNIRTYTYHEKTVYFYESYTVEDEVITLPQSTTSYPTTDWGAIAWALVYGTQEEKIEPKMVGRFAIDLKDAGGDGPGSDWDDPGDWNEDWEEGDPTQTLYVEVIGALSGRHNDPIVDPSYSYIPADKDTVKDYGCGGDGGHGGGGGAGASTVVTHKFATNQADSKDVTAIARRHGYGSGGGKGGKGGDGCILVYY